MHHKDFFVKRWENIFQTVNIFQTSAVLGEEWQIALDIKRLLSFQFLFFLAIFFLSFSLSKIEKKKASLSKTWDNRGRKAIKQSLYKERVGETGYNCDRENTIPYERFSHCIHAFFTISATILACPRALNNVKLSKAQTLNFTKKASPMSTCSGHSLSVLFFTLNIVFSLYLISP